MASKQRVVPPTGRSSSADDVHTRTNAENPAASSPEDFEFCILSSGGLALAREDAADVCVADEVFSGGKLLPLRLSSATSADASSFLLLRSDSLEGATAASTCGLSSRSVSRSSSSSCISRSTSSERPSADPAAGLGSSRSKSAHSTDTATVPPRGSLSSSNVFYAHPSPSPRQGGRSGASSTGRRRSTGSAPPATWGVILRLRLGVVGAPEVYGSYTAEYGKAAAARRGGRSRSARFERRGTTITTKAEAVPAEKQLALGLLGAGLMCSCSPDAVAPVGLAEAAAAEARRRRKKAEEKKRAAKQIGQSTTSRSRILRWLELSVSKKSVV